MITPAETLALATGFFAALRYGEAAFDRFVAWLERRFPKYHARHPRKGQRHG